MTTLLLSGCDLFKSSNVTGGSPAAANQSGNNPAGGDSGNGANSGKSDDKDQPTPTPTPTATPSPSPGVMKPPVHKATEGMNPPGIDPQPMFDYYGIQALDADGKGQTIAIVDAYGSPTIQKDLDTFSDEFDFPKTTVKVVDLTTPGNPGVATADLQGWAMETSLDVEWSHAVAPGATILLVQAKSASTADLLAAVKKATDSGAKQVSLSWGGTEQSGMAQFDTYFNIPGVTVFASSGDSGPGVSWPAVSQYVVAVGGTRLTFDANGNVSGEMAWTGSGGGVSKYTAQPTYQKDAGIKTTMRSVPDVAYNADPASGVSVYCATTSCGGNMPWHAVGGTSAGAPQWAGLSAVWNARRGAGLELKDALTNVYKYMATDFTDITTGKSCVTNNAGQCTNTVINAVKGYDAATGVGSPKFKTLSDDMVAAK